MLFWRLLAVMVFDGDEWRDLLTMLPEVGLATAALVGSILAIRKRAWSGCVFLGTALLGGVCFAWKDPRFLEPLLIGFAVPGIFWLMTADKGWPELFSDANRWRSLITIPIAILACWIPAFLFWFYFSPTDFGDCGEPPPFAKRHSPVEAVFIGKVVFVGGPSRFPRMGSWAVMRVEREYWGLPKLGSHLVIFRGFGLYEGEVGEYFVQAHRSLGLISHFFPIVEPGNCDRTRPLRLAEPELRVLRDGAPKSGVRIVGLVTRGVWLGPPAAGIGVSIQGPDGTTVLTTDQSGT